MLSAFSRETLRPRKVVSSFPSIPSLDRMRILVPLVTSLSRRSPQSRVPSSPERAKIGGPDPIPDLQEGGRSNGIKGE